ncbi:MAG: hypothetical protein RI930_255 [Pseudomonadota bacterium]|jgi:hypothetical protein
MHKDKIIELNNKSLELLKYSKRANREQLIDDCYYRIENAKNLSLSDQFDSELLLEELETEVV